jgi:hypothetical protein
MCDIKCHPGYWDDTLVNHPVILGYFFFKALVRR